MTFAGRNWKHLSQVTQRHGKCQRSGKRQVRSLNGDHLGQVTQTHGNCQVRGKAGTITTELGPPQPINSGSWKMSSGERQIKSPLNWDYHGQVTQPHRKCERSGKRQVRSLNWDHLSQWQVAQAHSEHQLQEKTSYIHRRLQATSNITT